jgi:ligand-binding sensor protein
MDIEKTKINIELSLDRGLIQIKSEWPEYEVPIDIDTALVMITLLSHQIIDSQDEQEQVKFESDLVKGYKKAMIERFESIEPLDDED